MKTLYSFITASCCNLIQNVPGVIIVEKSQIGTECRIHGIVLPMVLNRHIGHRKKACREVAGGSQCALLRIGIKTDLIFLRAVVFREQPLVFQPHPEILPHQGFQYRTAQRQFAGVAGPFKPFMRCNISNQGTAA